MDRLKRGVSGSAVEPALVYALMALVPVLWLSTVSGSRGWGEGLVLLGLSAFVNLAIAPEIDHHRRTGSLGRVLSAFILLQVVLGAAVGITVALRVQSISRDIWQPAGLTATDMVNELFKLSIGVSEDGNLLPWVAWIVGFHGIFLSTLTSLGLFVALPSMGILVLGYLWDASRPVGISGYVFLILFVAAIGLEGLRSGLRSSRSSGMRAPVLVDRGRKIALLSLIVVVLAPMIPDLTGVTPVERLWDVSETGVGGSRGVLRFSTNFGFQGRLMMDPSPAFEVRSDLPLFWRGFVYDTYTGREFLLEDRDSDIFSSGESFPLLYAGPDRFIRTVEQDYHLLSPFPGVLLSAYEPRSVSGVGAITVTDSRMLLTPGSNQEGTDYSIVSAVVSPDIESLRSSPRFSDPDPRYIQLPDSVPERVGELAVNITRDADNPFDKALAVAQYLRGFTYSLDVSNIPPGRDAVDYFLFESQAGYCQHFAAAMAILCREVGLPSRVVSGFGSGAADSGRKVYRILQLNSHSWVEVQFVDHGWVTFDPTPGGVGGPLVVDAAEANTVFGGAFPYYGPIERSRTFTYVTDLPDYVSEEVPFRIEGRVMEAGGSGVPRIEMNVTLNTTGLDIFPSMVNPREEVGVLMLASRTDSSGDFSALCLLPDGISRVTDDVELTVVCKGNDFFESSETLFMLPTRKRTTISLSPVAGERPGVSIILRGPVGPLPSQEVDVFLDGGKLVTGVTDRNGTVVVEIPGDLEPGVVSARFSGNGTLGGSSNSLRLEGPATEPDQQTGSEFPSWILYPLLIILSVSAVALARGRLSKGVHDSIPRIYHRMLEVMDAAGFGRGSSMTPYEFANWVESSGTPVHGDVRDLTDRYVEATYAGSPRSGEEIAKAQTILDRISSQLDLRWASVRGLRRWISSLASDLRP